MLEKCNIIWKKVSSIIKDEFGSKPVYNEKYLKSIRMKECKYVVKEKKMSNFNIDNIEVSSDNCDRENSDKEKSSKEN